MKNIKTNNIKNNYFENILNIIKKGKWNKTITIKKGQTLGRTTNLFNEISSNL